ncbi:LxmA leader domain family RiPP [Streptomyces sp. NPDC127098]|uniref:LxmA leader domain family RiPP n=1 Tax=Streptomyces sp. NPDC127098 TaxID=3347137 RepID=UPI00364C0348
MEKMADLMSGYVAYTSAVELTATVDEAPAYTPTISLTGTCTSSVLTLLNGC